MPACMRESDLLASCATTLVLPHCLPCCRASVGPGVCICRPPLQDPPYEGNTIEVKRGHVCFIPGGKDWFIALGDHPEWGTSHPVSLCIYRSRESRAWRLFAWGLAGSRPPRVGHITLGQLLSTSAQACGTGVFCAAALMMH